MRVTSSLQGGLDTSQKGRGGGHGRSARRASAQTPDRFVRRRFRRPLPPIRLCLGHRAGGLAPQLPLDGLRLPAHLLNGLLQFLLPWPRCLERFAELLQRSSLLLDGPLQRPLLFLPHFVLVHPRGYRDLHRCTRNFCKRTVRAHAINAVALLLLFGCQLAGEILHRVFWVPMPGPVTGMLLLTLILLRKPAAIPEDLAAAARVLLQNLGLFFVPAGVGVVANIGLIRQQWMPICVALVGSTCLSLLATACTVNFLRLRSQRRLHDQEASVEK